MNKIIHEEKLLIREIKDLITRKCFVIKLFKKEGLEIGVRWASDTTISIEDVFVVTINKWKLKKCITSERLAYELKELESRIGSICRLCDTVAKNKGINKAKFFEDLLEKAKNKCK